jgi:hypothetical protein
LGRNDVLTTEGTVNKTGISLVILLAAATWIWKAGFADPRIGGLFILGRWVWVRDRAHPRSSSKAGQRSRHRPYADIEGFALVP